VYEDFTDQTFLLLENLLANLSNEDSGGSLLTSFNDVDISSAVTYHFRVCDLRLALPQTAQNVLILPSSLLVHG